MKKIIALALAALGLFMTCQPAAAATQQEETQNLLQLDQEALDMVNRVLNNYSPWERVTYSGKLRTSALNLPVTPTVRIFAIKDRLVQLSVSAPFVGEVGRLELTPQHLTVINKFNKTYVRESTEKAIREYPGLISDIQSLLLGRMVIFGTGQFSLENLQDVIMEPAADNEWIVAPRSVGDERTMINYGYVVSESGRTKTLYGAIEGRGEYVTLNYGYNGGFRIDLDANTGKKRITGSLDFQSVKWGGSQFSEVNLDRYTKVSMAEFIKNYK